VALGAGRGRVTDVIDPAVGFVLDRKVGEAVRAGEPLCTIHLDDEARLPETLERLLAAYQVGPEAPPVRPLVLERLE
jgi:pyrimidine-nucleoside phosphorylase